MRLTLFLIAVVTVYTVNAKTKVRGAWYHAIAPKYLKSEAPDKCVAEYDAMLSSSGNPTMLWAGLQSYMAEYSTTFIGKYYCLDHCVNAHVGSRLVTVKETAYITNKEKNAALTCDCVSMSGSSKYRKVDWPIVTSTYNYKCIEGNANSGTVPDEPVVTVGAEFLCDEDETVFLVSQDHQDRDTIRNQEHIDVATEKECLEQCRARTDSHVTPCYVAIYNADEKICHLYGDTVREGISDGNGDAGTGLEIGPGMTVYEKSCVSSNLMKNAVKCNDNILHKLPGYAHVSDEMMTVLNQPSDMITDTLIECAEKCYLHDEGDGCPCSFATRNVETGKCNFYAAGKLKTWNDMEVSPQRTLRGYNETILLSTCMVAHRGVDTFTDDDDDDFASGGDE